MQIYDPDKGSSAVFVYSGSFNPLHDGHLAIANYAERSVDNGIVVFEICKTPFDKPEIPDDDMTRRVKQFQMIHRPLVLTNAPSFVMKTLYKDAYYSAAGQNFVGFPLLFCVGGDTIVRLNDRKYFFGNEDEKLRSYELIKNAGFKFMVFPRIGVDMPVLAPQLEELCVFAGPDFQPVDVSSTELRNRNTASS